jgi:hypothetical protein
MNNQRVTNHNLVLDAMLCRTILDLSLRQDNCGLLAAIEMMMAEIQGSVTAAGRF